MNKLRANKAYKIGISALLAVSLLLTALCGAAFVYMANENYYQSPDGNLLSVQDVPYEKTTTPITLTASAVDQCTDMLTVEVVSPGDAPADDMHHLASVELPDGRTAAVYLPESASSFLSSDVSVTIKDNNGKTVYWNRPAERESVLKTYLIVGLDRAGDPRHVVDYNDELEEYPFDAFRYEYITHEGLYDYIVKNCRHLYCDVYGDTYYDYFVDVNPDNIPSDSDAESFPDNLYYSNLGQSFGFLHIPTDEPSDEIGVYIEEALADYAWAKYQSHYYHYGYDEEKDMYYVAQRYDEYLTPAGIIELSASLVKGNFSDMRLIATRELYDTLYPLRVKEIIAGAASAAAALLFFILLLFSAGWKEGEAKPQLRPIDKIPLGLFVAVTAFIVLGLLALFDSVYSNTGDIAGIAVSMLYVCICVVIGIIFCMSIARRIKTRTLFKNTLCVHIFKLAKKIFSALPFIWTTVIVGIAYGLITFICWASREDFAAVLWIFISLGLLAAVCFYAAQFGKLAKSAAQIADGDAREISADLFFPNLKKHAENINRMGDSVSAAVDARLKSERMKTDLIANVSHDIKTPLTSVINYIDLLGRTDITDPTALEYIAVLERQSVRLKRLVQDIVEASKASSGCINAELDAVDLHELLDQAIAEYGDKLSAGGITPVLNIGENCRAVTADGRLLWRVFDNLLSNISKYSQPGTRAYIEAARIGDNVEISFRSISAEPLNIPAETLMERFVRGDRSRHTDGSGLGLSIARSLVELQNGDFRLSIDGDLFRAAVILPACEPAPSENDSLPEEAAVIPEQPTLPELAAQTEKLLPELPEPQALPEDEWLELPTLGSGDSDQ